MIKLIIFDLDGVLVDTENIHYESLVEAVKFITCLSENKFSHLLEIDGKTTKHKLGILKEELGLTDLQVFLIDDKKQQNVIRHFYKSLNTNPNQIGMLEELKSNYTLAIASNSRKENVFHILNILGITSFFSIILSNDDVTNHKPDPEIFLKIMEQTHIFPNETLILEDSPVGKYATIMSGAHLMPVDEIANVTLENIHNAIKCFNINDSSSNGRNGDKIL